MIKGPSEEQKRACRQKFDSFSGYIGARTVTFHWFKDDVPWQNGTGVLLRVGHRHFILTAAHVADEIKAQHDAKNPTFIVGGGMVDRVPIPLDRIVVLSSPLGGTKRLWDELYDIAAIEISPFVLENLAGHSAFLDLQQLDLAVDQSERSQFYIFGFPAASNEPDNERRALTTTAFPIYTKLFQGDLSELLFFDAAIGLVFNFDPQAGGGEGSTRKAMPLGGISGCGIWRIGSGDVPFMELEPGETKLVAIEHKEVSSSKAIIGTRIKFALQMIHCDYPDLREAFASVFPSLY
jgi:hypothetical protein